MKTYLKLGVCALACLLEASCSWFAMDTEYDSLYPYRSRATIVNQSDHSIVICEAAHNPMQPTVYPDTLLPTYLFIYYDNGLDKEATSYFDTPSDTVNYGALVKPGEVRNALLSQYEFAWDNFNKQFPAGYYSVFIIDGETVLEKSWETIRKDNDYIVRYDLTFYDLKTLKQTIPFPPTEDMRDMKMWPPYDEISSGGGE